MEEEGGFHATVTSNDDECIDIALAHACHCGGADAGIKECLATGCAEECASALNDVSYSAIVELLEMVGHEPTVPIEVSDSRQSLDGGRSNDRTDGCIHARCIAAAGEDANSPHLVTVRGGVVVMQEERRFESDNGASAPSVEQARTRLFCTHVARSMPP